jgi:AcrR family transcriptional regulator
MNPHAEKQILAAAIRQFSRAGYHGTSTAELAKVADVREPSIFRIFRSKENLFAVAVTVAIQQVANEVSSVEFALARAEDFSTAIRHAVNRTYECMSDEFLRLRSLVLIEQPALYAPFRKCVGLYEKAFARAIEREVGAGGLRDDLDPQMTAHQLVSYVLASKLFESKRRVEISSFVEMLLRGIGNQGRRPSETRENRG